MAWLWRGCTLPMFSWAGGVASDAVETAKLLASELATNAVRHSEDGEASTSPPSSSGGVQTFELSLEVVSGAVRLSVWDRDPRPPVLKEVGVDALGGRGIFIVAAMSRAWGYYPARPAPGKVVWAEIAFDATGPHKDLDAFVSPPGQPPDGDLPAFGNVRAETNLVGRVLVGINER